MKFVFPFEKQIFFDAVKRVESLFSRENVILFFENKFKGKLLFISFTFPLYFFISLYGLLFGFFGFSIGGFTGFFDAPG